MLVPAKALGMGLEAGCVEWATIRQRCCAKVRLRPVALPVTYLLLELAESVRHITTVLCHTELFPGWSQDYLTGDSLPHITHFKLIFMFATCKCLQKIGKKPFKPLWLCIFKAGIF